MYRKCAHTCWLISFYETWHISNMLIPKSEYSPTAFLLQYSYHSKSQKIVLGFLQDLTQYNSINSGFEQILPFFCYCFVEINHYLFTDGCNFVKSIEQQTTDTQITLIGLPNLSEGMKSMSCFVNSYSFFVELCPTCNSLLSQT